MKKWNTNREPGLGVLIDWAKEVSGLRHIGPMSYDIYDS